MMYFGGKARIANDIVKVLEHYRKPNQIFVEPFVGGANIVSKMSGVRFAFDRHEELIEMYKALQNGWIPPTFVTEEEYQIIRHGDDKPLKAFVGFGCSFSGKYYGGYAKNSRGDKYCEQAHNSILKKISTCKDVVFECKNYQDLDIENALIYCDPPYADTTKYKFGEFDSEEFWNIMRKWSEKNDVFISEYKAPEDFIPVWMKKTKTEIRTKENGREDRMEKLFILNK